MLPAVPTQRQNINNPYYSPSSNNTSPNSTFMRSSGFPMASSNSSQSPTNGATTPNSNPLSLMPKQLAPAKSVMYRPAVLRTTERPQKNQPQGQQIPNGRNPLTPPPSQSPSLTSLDGDSQSLAPLNIPGSSLDFGDGEIAGMDPIFEDDDTQNLNGKPSPVTGPPTRAHWKPDSDALTCDAPTCVKQFTFFERRHHCRRCGNVFCAMHTPHFLRLDQNCKFHPNGELSRACDTCFNDYRKMIAQRRASNASSNRSGTTTPSIPSSPIVRRKRDELSDLKVGSFVGSVPKDWSWSTF